MAAPRTILAALAALVMALLALSPALADSVQRTVGDYTLTVGYAGEPPYLEEGNALTVEVRDARTGEPVTGLERALRMEGAVVVGETVRTYPMVVRAVEGRPGVYEGVFVPPAIGEYRFRVIGSIHGTEVDETFVSGREGLAQVEARTGLDYTERGSVLAVGILAAYVAGVAGIVGYGVLRRRSRTGQGRPGATGA